MIGLILSRYQMKATAFFLFLAFCGIASAILVQDLNRQQQTCDAAALPDSVFSGCNGTSEQAICAVDCAGAVCNYWNSQGNGTCSELIEQACENVGESVPFVCMTGRGGGIFTHATHQWCPHSCDHQRSPGGCAPAHCLLHPVRTLLH